MGVIVRQGVFTSGEGPRAERGGSYFPRKQKQPIEENGITEKNAPAWEPAIQEPRPSKPWRAERVGREKEGRRDVRSMYHGEKTNDHRSGGRKKRIEMS